MQNTVHVCNIQILMLRESISELSSCLRDASRAGSRVSRWRPRLRMYESISAGLAASES